MQKHIRRTAALAVASLLLAGTAQAQARFQPATYGPVTPRCTEGQAVALWSHEALYDWQYGQGRPENMALCAALAARAGNVPAETLLGEIYSFSRKDEDLSLPPPFPDPEAALYWFGKAADGGDGHAALEAGMLYELGMGANQDDARAAQWYQRAVTLGDNKGTERLNRLTARPARIAAFDAQYKAKAAGGDGAAMYAIAMAYFLGDPYIRNLDEGLAWLKRAADAGSAPAQSAMSRVMIGGAYGAGRDPVAYFDGLIKAAGDGNHSGDAQLLLGYIAGRLNPAQMTAVQQLAIDGKLRNAAGQPVHFNPKKAAPPDTAPAEPRESLDSLTTRAQGGNGEAQTLLGLRYLNGDGVAADPATARVWLEKAADQNATAAMNLGDMAYTGQGQPADPAAAADWYARAAVFGDADGAKNAEAIWNKAGTPIYAPVKAYAMALQMQWWRSPNAEAALAPLRAVTSPDMRADALIWLCRLRLAHASNPG